MMPTAIDRNRLQSIAVENAFSRSAALLGEEAMAQLTEARIIVFGVGGVGGWCAEALVRTGVGRIAIVDGDTVAPSNVNRQIMATSATIGRPKVEVLAERLREINPVAEVSAHPLRFSVEAADFFASKIAGCGCAIDAIDSVADKAALIRLCASLGVPVFSSMGAALRLDPTKVRVSRFAKVQGDGLARALRNRFRRDGMGAAPDFLCVHSEEPPLAIEERGSLMPVTATFGMALASLAIRELLPNPDRCGKGRKIVVAEPHGFCAGVKRAISIAEKTLAELPPGKKLYCLHALVHNEETSERLAARGVVFVESLSEIPDGANILIGAHGVSPAVRMEAARRGMAATDATCPAVARLHENARRHAADGRDVILLATRDHDETVGVVGEAPDQIRVVESAAGAEALSLPDGAAPAVLSQTTLPALRAAPMLAALRRRFPGLVAPERSGACGVTEERQKAIRALAAECDLVIVVGSGSSANARRLAETARTAGARAELLSDLAAARDFAASGGMRGARKVAVASAASTPAETVEAVAEWLRGLDDDGASGENAKHG